MMLYKEIEKTFPMMEKVLTKKEMTAFRDTPTGDLCRYHFSLGAWIRNSLLRPENSVLYSLFLENGVEHLDDMSSCIITLFHYHISKKG